MEIKILVMDVDGTLTDGKIYMSETGESMKAFSVKDGYGIHSILPVKQIIPVIITGRNSGIVWKRAQELDILYVYQNVKDKLECLNNMLREICEKENKYYDLSNVAYIGDDLNDLGCIKEVGSAGGVTGCPKDAVRELKEECHFISAYQGGEGAVREFIDWINNIAVTGCAAQDKEEALRCCDERDFI